MQVFVFFFYLFLRSLNRKQQCSKCDKLSAHGQNDGFINFEWFSAVHFHQNYNNPSTDSDQWNGYIKAARQINGQHLIEHIQFEQQQQHQSEWNDRCICAGNERWPSTSFFTKKQSSNARYWLIWTKRQVIFSTFHFVSIWLKSEINKASAVGWPPLNFPEALIIPTRKLRVHFVFLAHFANWFSYLIRKSP